MRVWSLLRFTISLFLPPFLTMQMSRRERKYDDNDDEEEDDGEEDEVDESGSDVQEVEECQRNDRSNPGPETSSISASASASSSSSSQRRRRKAEFTEEQMRAVFQTLDSHGRSFIMVEDLAPVLADLKVISILFSTRLCCGEFNVLGCAMAPCLHTYTALRVSSA